MSFGVVYWPPTRGLASANPLTTSVRFKPVPIATNCRTEGGITRHGSRALLTSTNVLALRCFVILSRREAFLIGTS